MQTGHRRIHNDYQTLMIQSAYTKRKGKTYQFSFLKHTTNNNNLPRSVERGLKPVSTIGDPVYPAEQHTIDIFQLCKN